MTEKNLMRADMNAVLVDAKLGMERYNLMKITVGLKVTLLQGHEFDLKTFSI